MSNNCNSLTEILRKIEPSELNEVSEISKKFNEFLFSVLGNEFEGGLMKSLEWLNFSDNKKDLIMTIFKIDPNYDLKTLQGMGEDHLLSEYLRIGNMILELNDDGLLQLQVNEEYLLSNLYIPIILNERGLNELIIEESKNLECIVALPDSLYKLKVFGCNKLLNLGVLPKNLKMLELRSCNQLENISVLNQGLLSLVISFCSSLKSLEGFPEGLEKLHIDGCDKLESLRVLPEGLKEFTIGECPIKYMRLFPDSLYKLEIYGCNDFFSLEGLSKGLIGLMVSSCSNLVNFGRFPEGLRGLYINDCKQLKILKDLPNDLMELIITYCSSLESIDGLPEGLKELKIDQQTYDQLDEDSKAKAQKINRLKILN